MHTRTRRLLLVLLAIVAAAFAATATAEPSVLADGVCNAGTHWDNFYNACVQ